MRIVIAILMVAALTSGAADRHKLAHKHVPNAVAAMSPIGDLDPTNKLHIAINLSLRNQDKLDELMANLYNPAHPLFHKWITPEEFTARFGPTESDCDNLLRWAKTNGLTIEKSFKSSRRMVIASGRSKDIEKSLGVKFKSYRHPKEGRIFFSSDREPTVDCPASISSIEGLNTYSLPKANSGIVTNWTANAGTAPGGLYWRTDYQKAYLGSTNYTGSGQNIGSVQLADWWDSDIQFYTGDASVTSRIHRVLVNGAMPPPDVIPSIEPSLDIEMQWCMAPQANYYAYLYNVTSFLFWTDIFERIATDNVCKQISSSYTGGIGPITDWFVQMAAQGQTLFWASGDSGSMCLGDTWDYTQNEYTTQVGATDLVTDTGGSYVSESAWYLSTGGLNPNYPCPAWQLPLFATVPLGSCPSTSACRMIPDVCAVGDAAYTCFGNGFCNPVAGTSVAAPLWAGLMALVNKASGASGPIGAINASLYSIASSPVLYSTCLRDITSGNNISAGCSCGYPAATGYDLASGLGSPNSSIIWALSAGTKISLVFSNGLFIRAY